MQAVADNAVQTHAAETSDNGEKLCVFTLREMRTLLKVATDTSKSVEERKAELRKIFSQAREKNGNLISMILSPKITELIQGLFQKALDDTAEKTTSTDIDVRL
ncbi:MAG: hypothetical protein IJS39_01475 [Synergistaceae bacterium]|nr:hypothetical protein [Synergistaceae bacterium]